MMQPFLFVGVGGSGGKTLRVVREELEQRLRARGWDRKFPEAWQFVQIDVPTRADGEDHDLPVQLPTDDYVGLVSPNTDYANVDTSLMMGTSADGGKHSLAALVGWRPESKHVTIPIEKGAGQYRAIGRAVAVANLATIRTAIGDSVRRLAG